MAWVREPQFWVRSAGFPAAWIEELTLDDELSGLLASSSGSKTVSLPAATVAAFEARSQEIRKQLAARMQRPDFEEAVFLSNPESFARLSALAARLHDGTINARGRQHLRLAWSYMQRLCTKNDTASFFGPIGWGRASTECEGVRLRSANSADAADAVALPSETTSSETTSSDAWLGRRITNFEHWAIQAFADAISEDEEIQPYLPLRVNPELRLHGDALTSPAGQCVTLEPNVAGLLQLLKEAAPAKSEHELLEPLVLAGESAESLRARLALLLRKGVLERALVVPTVAEAPEARLRELLEQTGAPGRERWLQALDHLCELRDALARAAWPQRMSAMQGLTEALHGVLGKTLDRERGQMYVGRFVTYEDCERNTTLELGGSLLAELDRGLTPILGLYERTTRLVAHYVDSAWRDRFEQLSPNLRCVPLSQLYPQLMELDPRADISARVRSAIVSAWTSVLGPNGNEAERELSAMDLQRAGDALQLPEADLGSWVPVLSGTHSPDVLLAAEGTNAIARGQYRWVLGEVHPGVNTVAQPVARPFCPDPDSIDREVQAHLEPGLLCLADPRVGYQRSHINWPDVHALHEICFRNSPSRVPAARRIAAADVEVGIEDGRLIAYGHGIKTPLVSAMPALVHRILFGLAQVVVGGEATARLTFGKFVLKRRTWSILVADLPRLDRPAESAEDYRKFVAWAEAAGLPRRFFAKVEGEAKPIFVDVRNPLSVDLFVKQAAQAPRCLLSEMLPEPGELWFRDSRGACTSELRLNYRRAN